MKNKTNTINTLQTHGFTLVELIVVITILGILGTIAFVSLQSFAGDTRDTKRSSDISSIIKTIEIAMISGRSAKSFVTSTTGSTGSTITDTSTGTSTSTGARIRISGAEGYDSLSGVYVAGNVNYTALGLKKEDFSDPLKPSESYRIGVTEYNLPQYEVAGTIEGGGNPDTFVRGTWNPRVGGTSYSGTQNSDMFLLDGITVNVTNLRLGDIVRFNSSSLEADKYKIVATNASMIRVDRVIASPGSVIFLHGNETRRLIKKWDSMFPIDLGKGATFTPYKLN